MNRIHAKSMNSSKRAHGESEIIRVKFLGRGKTLKKVQFIQGSSLRTTGGDRFRSESDAEGRDGIRTKTRELTLGLGNGKDGYIIDGSNECTLKLALRGTQ
jgi:hypothetical protein